MNKASFLRSLRSEKLSPRVVASMALLAALNIVLARFIIPMPNAYTRFSIEAVPVIISGYLFGPVCGALTGFTGDLAGCLFSPFGYNPVFSVPPVLYGLCAGCLRFLIFKKISPLRILASFLPALVAGSVLWQSFWLSVIYGSRTFQALLYTRAVQFAVTGLIDTIVIFALFKSRVFHTLSLWPPKAAALQEEQGS